MAEIRVVFPQVGEHLQRLAEHVKTLQDSGRHVVFVTANRPVAVLEPTMAAAGVDTSRMQFVDAITLRDGSRPTQAASNVLYLQSPTMLEMIAMRIEQALALDGREGHLVLDSLNALQLYNGLPLVQEFCHYLINRLRTRGAAADLVALSTPEGEILAQAVAGFTDGRHDIGVVA